ncbi:MAG: pyruvate, phosphate dikinase [Dehalococcoidia bacterium]|nr:pyruvate, phosphate dikinase [Dehalococcoidia bacterium]
MTKYVYRFRDGDASMRDLLGGKGAGLAEMTRAGAPVPPGFTITTEACNHYSATGDFPAGMWEEVVSALADVERAAGKRFGNPENPLLVSVRSGAKFSMPGMMDTVLNLGLNAATKQGLAAASGDARFAADAYRRFVQLFGKIVLGVDGGRFEDALSTAKGPVRQDTDLSADELRQVTEEFKTIIQADAGVEFPDEPLEQLRAAIAAVFRSWNGRRAVDYRRLNKIPDSLGTAVNVQTMVFGNLGNSSATGVAFSRNPSTGDPALYGEYLVNAQGEDVVAGIRTPRPITEMEREMPEVYEQFARIARQLEEHYRDVQDMEFTVERGRLYMLQTRTGKRTGAAAVKIAVDMANEGLIDRRTAIQRVEPAVLDQLLHPTLEPKARENARKLTRGLPASPGAATGRVVFDPDLAEERAKAGEAVILVRTETAPEDFHGMVAAQAVLTARGGMTSHAAVVARGMGKPCVAGASELIVNYEGRFADASGTRIREGDPITLDGSTGEVFLGVIETREPELSEDFRTLMSWTDQVRQMEVRANADTPKDARTARSFGAQGIGLCRTEHMFFEGTRIDAVREMILAESTEERRRALATIEPYQKDDFVRIFKEMDGLPVTIRTLDPPLHEFLPHDGEEMRALAEKAGMSYEQVSARVAGLREANPMLGFRGCRLGIVYPEITEMQARAIFTAAKECAATGVDVRPEIMIPLVGTPEELRRQAEVVREQARHCGWDRYLIGTMIELPRAALVADKIAEYADFFSFGTNDLTQTTMGISRDDSGHFVPAYIESRLYEDDPFQVLDQEGVGQLVRMGVERGRKTKPDLKTGICGEHGGDPSSVLFFAAAGLNYVSCSPYRVPIARLAAAHAALGDANRDK